MTQTNSAIIYPSSTLFLSAFQSEYLLSAMKKEMLFTPSPRSQFKTLLSTESEYNSKIILI